MEIFGAWLFLLGIILLPIIFIIYLILDIKYKEDLIREPLFDIAMWFIFLCWMCIAGGIALVYYF
jgi:4-hydroxybenzoate polyprenyltransferase